MGEGKEVSHVFIYIYVYYQKILSTSQPSSTLFYFSTLTIFSINNNESLTGLAYPRYTLQCRLSLLWWVVVTDMRRVRNRGREARKKSRPEL